MIRRSRPRAPFRSSRPPFLCSPEPCSGSEIALPSANLNLRVQFALGINRVLESYLSSRHHNGFWVKGGYVSIDASLIAHSLLNKVIEYTTIRAGMFEPNYGDALYRRREQGSIFCAG